MNYEEFVIHLTEVDTRSKSNTRRIEQLEQSTDVLHKLATSIEVMATKQETMNDNIQKMDAKITVLEEKPAKRWDALIASVISSVVGIVVGAILRGLV